MSSDSTQPTSSHHNETLLVIDGHSLAFRAFYALPVESFTASDGQNTNAVYGFLMMLAQVIEAETPQYLAVAFDVKGGTFRNEMLTQYKGTRQAAPPELLSQLPLIQEALQALGVTYIEKQGYEGDDLIATIATMGEDAGMHSLVLSGDRDAFQLIDDSITVLYPGHHFKDLKHMTPQAVEEKYHVTPQQYPDLAALRGETADNIPGVPGVGDGFAAKWINQYGSLEGIIEHAEEISGKKGQALRENIEQVQLNRQVNTLVRDVEIDEQITDFSFGSVDVSACDALFARLEFGNRTRNKLMKIFNEAHTDDVEEQIIEDEQPSIDAPILDAVHDNQSLLQWAQQYVPQIVHVNHDNDMNIAQEIADHQTMCVPLVEQSWVLFARGNAKPGQSDIRRLTLCANNHAVVIDPHKYKDSIQEILQTYASTLIVHGTKETMHMLASENIDMPMPMFDTKLAAYVVEPDFTPGSVDACAQEFLHIDMNQEEHAQESQGTLDFEDDTDQEPAMCAALVHALARTLARVLDERNQYDLLRTIEIPTACVLNYMEEVGSQVDLSRLKELRDRFGAQADEMQHIAWDSAGHEFNLQSPKQLGEILFEQMGLSPTKKTKKGSYTTNAAALQTLFERSEEGSAENLLLGALLRHRETNKLKQIVQTLIDARNTNDGRIHTTFEQTVTTTGRLSSVDPNLQNIPNRNADGRDIRSAFIAGEGYESLLSADYSQVELRIMADLSGDEALIEAFRSGRDFHKYVASLVFNKSVDDISSDERSHVKAMSYGLAYGLSTYGLSQQLGVSQAHAKQLRDQYFATFGKVHEYLESLVANARKLGYTQTMFGRRRYFPALRSTNRIARDAAERGALNAPIQGTAADIMKIAMIRADHALRVHKLRSRIVLQIHDELVVEIAPGEQEEVVHLVKDAMEHAVDLAVPLDVSTGIGADWQSAAH